MIRRDFNLEFEAGDEWIRRDATGTTGSAGYRADF